MRAGPIARLRQRHDPLPVEPRPTTVQPPDLRLITPGLERLTEYETALVAGWSPDTERDVSTEQLAALRRNPHAFLFDLTRQDGMIVTAAGRQIPRLPSRAYWLDDGDFSGVATLRFMPGSDALPDEVSGHIGYAVVPWKRRRGYATRALALMLPIAHQVGLSRVEITCDDDNEPSRRVIVKNGGVYVGSRAAPRGKTKLVFHIDLTRRPDATAAVSAACGRDARGPA